jgi:hypothetical protein
MGKKGCFAKVSNSQSVSKRNTPSLRCTEIKCLRSETVSISFYRNFYCQNNITTGILWMLASPKAMSFPKKAPSTLKK